MEVPAIETMSQASSNWKLRLLSGPRSTLIPVILPGRHGTKRMGFPPSRSPG
jgi:hypothetical protein